MCQTDKSGKSEGSCSRPSKSPAYFYVEFLGIKEREIDTNKLMGGESDSGEEWKKALGEGNPLTDGLPKKFKIPEGDVFGTTIYAESGLFVPSAIIDYLKSSFNLDKVSFQLIHKISKEEYQAELEYQQHQEEYREMYKKLEDAVKAKSEEKKTEKKEVKLKYDVRDELDSLISSVESGRLHVIGPAADEPDFEKPPSDDDLLGGNFEWGDE